MKNREVILGVTFVIIVFLIVLSQKGRVTGPHDRRAVMGLEAPEFTLLDNNGTSVKLSQFKEKTIFVHFWAAWCKECREELPGIQALYDRKKSDPDFVFLSVIYREDPAKSKKYLDENNYDIPIFVDPDEKAARVYGLTGVPETFIIDQDGLLKRRIIGPGRWEEI